jgi:hypothetical protein
MIIRNNILRHNDMALNYHAITGMALDSTTLIFSITVGSWLSEETSGTAAPALTTVLDVRYGEWSAEHAANAKETVEAHPEWTGLPPFRPSPHHLFDMNARTWVDPRTLQDLKDAKWLEVKQARNAAELGPFTYNAMVFDGDLNAQRRLAAYISVSKSALAAGQAFSAEFTLADNTQVTLSAQDFVGIELAKVQAVAAAFAYASVLRGQGEAATTPEEVASVVWAATDPLV